MIMLPLSEIEVISLVIFLTSGIDGADYFVFQTNNGVLLAILKITDFGCTWETHKWI